MQSHHLPDLKREIYLQRRNFLGNYGLSQKLTQLTASVHKMVVGHKELIFDSINALT